MVHTREREPLRRYVKEYNVIMRRHEPVAFGLILRGLVIENVKIQGSLRTSPEAQNGTMCVSSNSVYFFLSSPIKAMVRF